MGSRTLYYCSSCGRRHYSDSARGRDCPRSPVLPLVGITAVLLIGGVLGLTFTSPGKSLVDDIAKFLRLKTESKSEETVRVVSVVDGDTIRVRVGGDKVRVRLLGIDASEVARAGEPAGCYGDESSDALGELVPVGTRVTLLSDSTQQDRDRYGRLLRYVELQDGRDVGELMVRQGAATARVDDPPVARLATYERAENRARGGNAGLWAVC